MADKLQQAVSPTPKPVKVFAQDESRFGLHTIRRRRLTAKGVKPIGMLQQEYKSFWLYGAIAPTTGEPFFLELPTLTAATFQVFLDQFADAYPDTLNVLILDNSRCHTAKTLTIPEHVVLVFQPPYSPELNPAERVWQDLKADLAWKCFTDLNEQQEYVSALICSYDTQRLRSLTGYPYLVEAIHALCP